MAQNHRVLGVHLAVIYKVLFDTMCSTLKTFGFEAIHFGANIAMTAVLHTHNRQLDSHPTSMSLCRSRCEKGEKAVEKDKGQKAVSL